MRNLTRLVLVFVLAALGWGLYWWTGARASERGFTAWIDARAAEGWQVETADVTTRGFPNRFDTTFDEISLADPETGVAWTAPWFQIFALSYKPNHLIAAWPPTQHLALPQGSIDIASDRMRASLELGPTPDLPWERSVIELSGLELTASRGWTASLDQGQIAMRETPEAAETPVYDIALSLSELRPESAAITRLRDTLGLADVVETLSANLVVTFDKSWDLTALEERRPQPRRIVISDFALRWGEVALDAAGDITVDPEGEASGSLTLDATNWREMVALAEASGALPEETVPLVTAALETLARLGGDPDRLDVPLRFARGLTFLGPVPIGAAPLIRIP